MAMNTFCHAPRSTPSRLMEVMLDVMPLPLRCQQVAFQSFLRLRSILVFGWCGFNTNKTYSVGHMKFWSDILSKTDINLGCLDECDEVTIEKQFRVNTEFKEMPPVMSQLNIFTDGSKIDRRVGAAYVMYKHREEFREDKFNLPETSTVFQAEMLAIREAARDLSVMVRFDYVRIFVDSQAALLALAQQSCTSKLVKETTELLNEAAKHKAIILCWTKAHVGTIGNERADTLAKEGAVGQNRIEIGMPLCEIKREATEFFYNRWKENFQQYEGARMGKLFYEGPDKDKAKYVLKLARGKLARFIRIISGHNSLFYFRSKVDPDVNPQCRFCLEADEDFEHLVNHCPRFYEGRTDKFQAQIITNDHMWSVQALLDFSYLPGISEALEGDTGLYLYGDHLSERSSQSDGESSNLNTLESQEEVEG